jgi:hypothetical protein
MIIPRTRIRPAGFDARPERPSSLRAQAQRIFRATAERGDVLRQEAAPTPDPSPPPPHRASAMGVSAGGGERAVLGDREQAAPTELTLQVRALYEAGVVPVAEIARLAGVSGRTVYKYAAKGGWRRRYPTQDIAAAVRKRAAKRKGKPPRPCATLKGAGGRFIRNADADQPVRRGIKALDPAGEAAALLRCALAAALADEAQARIRRLREGTSAARSMALMVSLLRDLSAAETAMAPRAAEDGDAGQEQPDLEPRDLEQMREELARKLDAAMRGWDEDAAAAAEAAGRAGPMRGGPR